MLIGKAATDVIGMCSFMRVGIVAATDIQSRCLSVIMVMLVKFEIVIS